MSRPLHSANGTRRVRAEPAEAEEASRRLIIFGVITTTQEMDCHWEPVARESWPLVLGGKKQCERPGSLGEKPVRPLERQPARLFTCANNGSPWLTWPGDDVASWLRGARPPGSLLLGAEGKTSRRGDEEPEAASFSHDEQHVQCDQNESLLMKERILSISTGVRVTERRDLNCNYARWKGGAVVGFWPRPRS